MSPDEIWLLRSMERLGYHGWVYLLGAVLCGATVAALVYFVAVSFRRREKETF